MSNSTNWWKVPGALSPAVTCRAWDERLQKDAPLAEMVVTVMLPISGTSGRYFARRCDNPQDLWDFLQWLDRDPEGALKHAFNYTGPTNKKRDDLDGVDLDKLLMELSSMNLTEEG